ncbi:MAG: phage tail tape measure protein [Acidobacteriota bacterium]|nr:phage tail tape measure protein [Acidobacteriota bacterium]
MSVLVNILTTYSGAGAKKAMRDMAVMQKQAGLAGDATAAGLLAASAGMARFGTATAAIGATLSKRVTLPLIGLGAGAVASAAAVDKGLNRVRAGTGATGRELEGLEASFRAVAGTSGRSFEEIGGAIADVNTRLGLTGRPLESVTKQFLTLSRVTGVDTATLLAQVSKAMNDAGIKSSQTAGFLDKLLVASQKTGVSVADLAGEMYRYGSPLRQLGFGLDQTIATLSLFEKSGVNTKLVMGSLRIALGKMAKAGEKDLPAGLAKGIEAIKNAKTGGEAASKAIELFGARAGPDMAAAIREGRFEVADLVKQLEGSSGAVERTGGATKTFAGKMAVLRNKAALAAEPFGHMLIPKLEQLVDYLGRVVEWLGRLSPGWRDFILKAGLAAAVLGPALVVVGKLALAMGRVVGVAGKLALAFGKGASAAPGWARGIAVVTKALASFVRQAALAIAGVARQTAAWVAETAAKAAATAATIAHAAATKAAAAAQWLLNAALTANPIGLVVAAVAALVAVIIILWKKNETFRRVVTLAWEKVKQAAVAVWDFLVGAFKKWGKGILVAITGPIGLLVVYALKHWDKIKTGASRTWGAIKSAAAKAWNAIKGALGRVWGLIVAAFKLSPVGIVAGHWQKIREGVSSAWGRITDAVRRLWDKVVGVFSGAYQRFKEVGSDVVRGIRDGLAAGWHWVTEKLDSLVSRLPKFARKLLGSNSPSRVFADIGADISAGLALGIKGSERAVRRASQELAAASLPAFGGPRAYGAVAGSGGRSTVVQVGRGAVIVNISSAAGGGVSSGDVQLAVDRAFRRLAAEIGRR